MTLLLLAVFAGTLYFLYIKSQAKPVVFKTTTPFVTTIINKAVATGSIVPRKEIEIKPQVSGVIEKIYVEPGDTVKKGAFIAKLEIIPDMINLNNAESRLNQAKINLSDARQEYDRRKKLRTKGIISEAEFLKYEIALTKSREELAAAESNLQLVREGTTRQSKDTAHTLIKSTINGMILDIPVEEGDSVIETNTFNAGTTIAVVADMTEMIFKGRVDESEVGRMQEGMDLILSIGAIEKDTFHAKLEHIAPKGVEEKGTIQFEIKAAIKLKKSQFLRAGYSANADIVFERRDDVLAVKESVLQFEGDKVFVEIENGPQQFEKKYIEVGLSDGINIEIVSGLSKSDKIKIGGS